MGVCASTLGGCGQISEEAAGEKADPALQTLSSGKVFNLTADAGGKAAEARVRSHIPAPPDAIAAAQQQCQVSPPVPRWDVHNNPMHASGGSKQHHSGSTTRTRRLSVPGGSALEAAAAEGVPAAEPTLPATASGIVVAAAAAAVEAAPPVEAAPMPQLPPPETGPLLPHRLPPMRVRFEVPPESPAQPHKATPRPPPDHQPSAAMGVWPSPSKRSPSGLTDLMMRRTPTPSKAAAAASVPMADLIHSVASLSRAGKEPAYRKQNQDNCFAYQQYCRPNQALLAALDGHGPHGHLVSGFLKERFPAMLADNLGEGARRSSDGSGGGKRTNSSDSSSSGSVSAGAGNGSCETAAALSATFLGVDAALQAVSGVNCQYSGSTAVVTMLQGRRLTTAWVGDSKAVLVRQDPRGCRAICLTRDHKPNQPEERARITANGGRVERLVDARGVPVGPPRVWLSSSWVPGLAMSRALGDRVAHSVGVSSEPETSVVELCPQDKFLILATDGVWEFIDPQAAVDIVKDCQDAEEACRTLVDCAWAKWLQEEEGVVDDITVVAIKFNPC